jgi:hypothetical protein
MKKYYIKNCHGFCTSRLIILDYQGAWRDDNDKELEICTAGLEF